MLNVCAELFKNYLEERDLTCESGTTSNGDSVIEFPYQGKNYKLFFEGPNGCYLSLFLVFEHVPDEKIADVIFTCNDLNCDYKWITFYVDKENDIVLHDDAILTIDNAADEAFELLLRMLKISEDVKPKLMRAIYA